MHAYNPQPYMYRNTTGTAVPVVVLRMVLQREHYSHTEVGLVDLGYCFFVNIQREVFLNA